MKNLSKKNTKKKKDNGFFTSMKSNIWLALAKKLFSNFSFFFLKTTTNKYFKNLYYPLKRQLHSFTTKFRKTFCLKMQLFIWKNSFSWITRKQGISGLSPWKSKQLWGGEESFGSVKSRGHQRSKSEVGQQYQLHPLPGIWFTRSVTV